MTTVQPQRSFIKYINLAVFIPMMLLATLTLTFYIVGGLTDAYDVKVKQVHDLSALLAISSSSAIGSTIASAQIAQIAYQDRTIDSAQFYPFERIESLSDPKRLDLSTILTQNTVSIQEPVASDVASHLATGLQHNRTLMGYINITVNLDELRKDWLRHHIYYILGIGFGYLTLTWLILYSMSKPLKQLKKLSSEAVKAREVDLERVNSLLNQEFEYSELVSIQNLFHDLNTRYKTQYESYKELKQHGAVENNNKMTSLQQSNFQNMISHEIKISLDAIFEGLQLLNNYYMNDEHKDVVETISKGSKQIESILNQIIQLNRIEKGQMSVQVDAFQPIQLINELIDKHQQHAQSRGVQIYSHINHIECILHGDEQKIRSILEALISNALKFTEKGSVKIESNLIYFEETIRWWINVIDTGVGIDEKYIKDILSPFAHSNIAPNKEFNDVGIGLGLANKLAQLLKGQILVESKVGKGSSFSLVLPLPNSQHFEDNNLLVGMKAIFFTQKDLSQMISILANHNTQVVKIEDRKEVLEYLSNNNVNLLVIAGDISFKQTLKLTDYIRDNEVSSHLLIVYYQENLTESQIGELQAAGVDLCRPVTQEYKSEFLVVKNWLGL